MSSFIRVTIEFIDDKGFVLDSMSRTDGNEGLPDADRVSHCVKFISRAFPSVNRLSPMEFEFQIPPGWTGDKWPSSSRVLHILERAGIETVEAAKELGERRFAKLPGVGKQLRKSFVEWIAKVSP